MANQYTSLHGNSFERTEATLRAQGYVVEIVCTYGQSNPKDFPYTGNEGGWELRRKFAEWCKKHEILDFKIIRNPSYVSDLHGRYVYELWINRQEGAR